MPLFQNTVVQKYLKGQDQKKIDNAFEKYKSQFHNPSIQENIRNAKEEQYQEGFLRDLFVNILGYTLNPDNNFNLTTELKNEKDSKKADGAILINNGLQPIVKAVIELKGTNTTDLGKVEAQAFGYKNNQQGCVYVVTSNFEKLRFYIDNAIEHIEFNLFTLNKEDFNLLYLCLAYENIAKDLGKKIKTESLSQEDAITKKLYKDYTVFKRALFNNLTKLNPETEPLLLFKKSQKLLDRFLFLFFAEDRHLLPPNSVRLILSDWKDLQERDVEIPLYNRFKKYFEYLNTGYKGKRYDVFPYNGGLFKPDEVLDHVKIDDDLLYEHTLRLSEYDFDSEVDVNILGHIFENSLNEIEEVQADLEGQAIDKSKTKRKKDGVFYTPKYITKYIVENTIGKLCTEKKADLELNEEEYTNDKKKQKKTIGVLLQKINDYRAWLLELTICDPACGSGAFLNEALDFLIKQHKILDELETKLMGGGLVFPNIENSILENNLFGVDLNEESVEIAKLSLWLRTAQPNRKLNDLSGNIKCGNSLIDDPAIAGDKAFNWQKAFPTVFKEKQKKPFHITWVTHNSRISQRMIDNKVKLGEAYWLEDEQEIMVAQTIKEIVEQDELNVMAFNSCGDHIHILLVCEEEEIPNIIRKLKGKSSQKLKEYLKIPKEKVFTLWAQKYSTTYIDSEDQLWNTVEYIRNNRQKHRLDTSNKVQLSLASSSNKGLQSSDGNKGLQSSESNKGLESSEGNKGLESNDGNKGLQPLVAVTTSNSLSQPYTHAFRTQYKGGFDVVIGNPPYVVLPPKTFKNYNYTNGNNNTYVAFVELSLKIVNINGQLSFIIPNTWFSGDNFLEFRNFIVSKKNLRQIIQLPYDIFEAYVDTSIVIIDQNQNQNLTKFYKYDIRDYQNNIDFKTLKSFPNLEWISYGKVFLNDDLLKIGSKVWFSDKNIALGEISKINRGSLPPKEDEKSKTNDEYHNIKWFDNQIFRYLEDGNSNVFVNYENLRENKKIEVYIGKRLLARQLMSRQFRMNVSIIDYDCAFKKNLYVIYDLENQFSYEFILSVLNSKLFSFTQVNFNSSLQRDDFPAFSLTDFKNFQIPKIPLESQKPFIEKADQMLALNKELQLLATKFQRSLQREFEQLEKLSKKLETWYALSYADFLKELKKKKVELNLSQKAEWEDYFLAEQQKALALKTEIDQTDKEIDAMVYELYGLTEEEIKIVEGS